MQEKSTEIYPREFDIGEILSIAWEIYRTNYNAFFPLAFVVYIPLNTFLAFFPITTLSEFNPSEYFTWFRTFGAMNIAVYLSFFGNVAIAISLKQILFTGDFTFLHVFKEIYSKFISRPVLNIFIPVLVFICFNAWMYFSVTYPVIFMILLIPITVYLVYWSFSIYVFSFKDTNLYRAMSISYSIVSGRWTKVFYYIISFILLSVLSSLLLGLPYSYLHDTILIKILYTNLVSVVVSYFVVAFIVFYINFEDTKL
ncbi:MAG: hypothetical protein WC313_09640 [Candidatus Kapaibacterium sp.]|jgi:hypothetical protein|nr:hypothetical protein [Candidatus Kapabacteria bacterium]